MAETEIKNVRFWQFVAQGVLISALLVCLIVSSNFFIDASEVIRPSINFQMARLSLDGNIVTTPINYNERSYQIAVVDQMDEMPETIVIGSSRGMFLSRKITGFENLYNNCVSGACMEDYYALLGLYYQKYGAIPPRIIIEISPWCFYKDDPEARWLENDEYKTAANNFYSLLNGREIVNTSEHENPLFSISYFQYNLSVLRKNGIDAIKKEGVKVSTDISEKAELPDGSIRYESKLEKQSEERLAGVKAAKGPVTYKEVDKMVELDADSVLEYENLIRYLKNCGTEIILYMQPFSETQCHYIFDEKTNPIFEDVENYLRNLGDEQGIKIIGGYDARDFDISDEYFIDFMHLDKAGTDIVWKASFNK